MSVESPKIFGRQRVALMKIYEILMAAEEQLPQTRLLLKAQVGPVSGNTLFQWLVEKGYIEKTAKADVKAYVASQRRTRKNIKGFYRITPKGREACKFYNALFDILGLSDKIQERFPDRPGVKVAVRTIRHSGRKIRA